MGKIVISKGWCLKWEHLIKRLEWFLTLSKYSRTISLHPLRLLLPESNRSRLQSKLFLVFFIPNKPNRSNLSSTEKPLDQKVTLLSESLMLLSLPSLFARLMLLADLSK